jgi:hypothetical protein
MTDTTHLRTPEGARTGTTARLGPPCNPEAGNELRAGDMPRAGDSPRPEEAGAPGPGCTRTASWAKAKATRQTRFVWVEVVPPWWRRCERTRRSRFANAGAGGPTRHSTECCRICAKPIQRPRFFQCTCCRLLKNHWDHCTFAGKPSNHFKRSKFRRCIAVTERHRAKGRAKPPQKRPRAQRPP